MFEIVEKNNLKYFIIPSFSMYGVKAFFSTRGNGVSSFPNDSLNLGVYTDDNEENIRENYNRICKAADLNYKSIVVSHQTHEDKILIADRSHLSDDFVHDKKFDGYDAFITNKRGITLVTSHADCVAVYFYDTEKNVIALAHAGWKGTLQEIAYKTVIKMRNIFNCDPKDIIAAISPSIGPENFEVSNTVADQFRKYYSDFIKQTSEEKYLVDLWRVNKRQLMTAGIPEYNITVAELCTYEREDLFFSYRRDGEKSGRMSAFISLP